MHVNLFVFFQTDDIIAINKPYGLPVHCKYMNERPGCFSGGSREALGWSLFVYLMLRGRGTVIASNSDLVKKKKKERNLKYLPSIGQI